MSKENSKKELLNLTITVEEIAQAARNATSLEDAVFEIETLNPRKIVLEQEIFTLKTTPVNDRVKGKKKEFAPKVVGVVSLVVESLSTVGKSDSVTINGTLDVPKKGNRVVKLDECLFSSMDDAKAVARVLTEIELEKAQSIADEAMEAVNFIKKQLEDDRF